MPLGLAIYQSLHNQPNSIERLVEALRGVDPGWFASLRFVVIARADGPWSLFYGEAVISPEARPGPCLNLERMRAVSESVPVVDFVERIQRAASSGHFSCAGLEIDTSEVFSQWSFDRHPSGREFSHWPCFVASGRNARGEGWYGPFATVVDDKTLYFRDGSQVVEHITSLSVFHGARDARLWSASIIIEDRRARILDATRKGDVLSVRVDGRALEGPVLSVRIRDQAGAIEHFCARLQPEVQVPLPMGPVSIDLGIVDGLEVLDDRERMHALSPIEVPENQRTESLVEQTRRTLNDGENATSEFKPWVAPSRGNDKFKEILSTVVAMANADGGTIIMGVDDGGVPLTPEGKILGPFFQQLAKNGGEEPSNGELEGDSALERTKEAIRLYARKVRDEVQQGIEPSANFDIEVVVLDAMPVVLGYVHAGSSPPYIVKETSMFFIRRSATNRRVSREEIMALCQRGRPS